MEKRIFLFFANVWANFEIVICEEFAPKKFAKELEKIELKAEHPYFVIESVDGEGTVTLFLCSGEDGLIVSDEKFSLPFEEFSFLLPSIHEADFTVMEESILFFTRAGYPFEILREEEKTILRVDGFDYTYDNKDKLIMKSRTPLKEGEVWAN